MNEIIKRIDEEIERTGAEADRERNGKAPYVVNGLEKAKKIIENCHNDYIDDFYTLGQFLKKAYEENDCLEYEKRFSAVQTKKYIEIIDSLMEKNEKLTKKKVKKNENISRTPDQIQELADGFIQLADRLKETKKELQEVKYQCKDWELEAKKAVAKLGEIMILMDGEKNNE